MSEIREEQLVAENRRENELLRRQSGRSSRPPGEPLPSRRRPPTPCAGGRRRSYRGSRAATSGSSGRPKKVVKSFQFLAGQADPEPRPPNRSDDGEFMMRPPARSRQRRYLCGNRSESLSRKNASPVRPTRRIAFPQADPTTPHPRAIPAPFPSAPTPPASVLSRPSLPPHSPPLAVFRCMVRCLVRRPVFSPSRPVIDAASSAASAETTEMCPAAREHLSRDGRPIPRNVAAARRFAPASTRSSAAQLHFPALQLRTAGDNVYFCAIAHFRAKSPCGRA